jgi:hypothetical protein
VPHIPQGSVLFACLHCVLITMTVHLAGPSHSNEHSRISAFEAYAEYDNFYKYNPDLAPYYNGVL